MSDHISYDDFAVRLIHALDLSEANRLTPEARLTDDLELDSFQMLEMIAFLDELASELGVDVSDPLDVELISGESKTVGSLYERLLAGIGGQPTDGQPDYDQV